MAEETRHLDPDEAFSLVADETRFAIVEALWNAEAETTSFSELREAVGVRDSGQFNYHLDRLTDHFVRKTDEGYALTHAGERVIGSILSGSYTRGARLDPIPIDADCIECGADLRATYEDERATIECESCGVTVTEFDVPPGILDGYEREALPGVFDRWLKSTMFEQLRGFCPLCTGRVRSEFVVSETVAPGSESVSDLGLRLTCDRCGVSTQSVLAGALFDQPALVAFAADHGVDLWETPVWELEWLITAEADVVSEAPPRGRVQFDLDGERLSLTVDEDLTAVAVERTSL